MPGTSTATRLKRYAAITPIAIRLNMLGSVRERPPPRTRKGQPAPRTTGVARTNSSQQRDTYTEPSIDRQADHRRHGQDHQRNGQADADPESPGKSTNSGLGLGRVRDAFLFQSHAADRAGRPADLYDLRVHRAGVDGAFGFRLGFGRPPLYLSGSSGTSSCNLMSKNKISSHLGSRDVSPPRDRRTFRKPDRSRKRSPAALQRISHGNPRSRNDTCVRHAHDWASLQSDRPACRTPDPEPRLSSLMTSGACTGPPPQNRPWEPYAPSIDWKVKAAPRHVDLLVGGSLMKSWVKEQRDEHRRRSRTQRSAGKDHPLL